MRISTQEFLLGSLPDMLAQQSGANQLNREIASGQTMLDAGSDPAGAAQALLIGSNISQLTVDTTAAQAAQQTAQTEVRELPRNLVDGFAATGTEPPRRPVAHAE